MAWGTEEDVDKIVRRLLKPIRARHKAEVERLKTKIAALQLEVAEEQDRANRAERIMLDNNSQPW